MTRTPIRPKLKDLQIGDRFTPAHLIESPYNIFEVRGKIRLGKDGAIRFCKNVRFGYTKNIECNTEVIKLFYCIECGAKVPDGEKYCNECVIVE